MTFSEIVESKKCKIDEVRLVGFQGQSILASSRTLYEMTSHKKEKTYVAISRARNRKICTKTA